MRCEYSRYLRGTKKADARIEYTMRRWYDRNDGYDRWYVSIVVIYGVLRQSYMQEPGAEDEIYMMDIYMDLDIDGWAGYQWTIVFDGMTVMGDHDPMIDVHRRLMEWRLWGGFDLPRSLYFNCGRTIMDLYGCIWDGMVIMILWILLHSTSSHSNWCCYHWGTLDMDMVGLCPGYLYCW